MPPPISAYGDLPVFEDAAIAPSGGRYAFVAGTPKGRLIVVVGADGKAQKAIPIGDMKLRAIEWIGDEDVFVTVSQTEELSEDWIKYDLEVYKVISIPMDGGDPSMVFAGQRSIANGVFGRYGIRKVNGDWHAYFGGVQLVNKGRGYGVENFQTSLFDVEPGSLKPSRMELPAEEGQSRDWLISPDGKTAATFTMTRLNGSWEVRNPQGKMILQGQSPMGDAGMISLGRTPGTMIFSQAGDDGITHWSEVSLADGASTPFLDDVDVDRIYTDRTTGLLIGYRQGGSKSSMHFYKDDYNKIVEKIERAFRGYNVTLMDWTPDFSKAILRTDGNGNAGQWYIVDVATLRAELIGMERPQIAPGNVGAISTVAYTAEDGLGMDGILTLPPGIEAKNLPLVMLPHGGPNAHDTASFDWWAQAFASRGYAVFQPNFRGSTNRDQAFEMAGDGEWGGKMQSDLTDGLNELVKKGIVDPKRACIVGASYGGYAALAGVTLQNGLYRCAVAVAGVSDLAQLRRSTVVDANSNRMTARVLERQLGDKGNLSSVSPRNFAAKADAPILLMHGRDDTVVDIEQSELMASALKSAGKPFEFIKLDGEDHWLSTPETRRQMLEAAVNFVEKYNPAG